MANLFSSEFASSFKQNSGIPAFEATDGLNRDIDSSKEDEEFSALSKPLPAFSNNETCKISDADIANQANIREYGVSDGVAAVKEVFTPDVIRSWENYSNDQRAEILDEFGKKISNALSIEEVSIKFDVSEKGVLGYNKGDGTIHLRPEFVENPDLLVRAIDTIAHEVRHQFQSEAMADPEKFGIDSGTLKEWKMADNYYDSADMFNPLSYEYNPLENDSQEYGRSIVRSFCREFADLAYGDLYNEPVANFA